MDLKVMFLHLFSLVRSSHLRVFVVAISVNFGSERERERVRLRSAYDTQLLYDFILGSLARCISE